MLKSDFQSDTLPRGTEAGKKLAVRRRSLGVFLVCLTISSLMWVFIELMKDYNDEIRYSIVFENVPKDLILVNSGDSAITAGVNAQGFELLAAKYLTGQKKLTIDLSKLRIQQTPEGYSAYMPSSVIMDQISKQIRFSKAITSMKPDTLFFGFSEIFRKQVPVMLDIDYNLGNQLEIVDTVDFFPRTVTVSSIKSVIDTLRFIKTMPVDLQDADSSMVLKVLLAKGRSASLLRYTSDSVSVKLNIQRVTEALYTVPVTVEAGSEKVRIFPDKVEIHCRVPLAEFPKIKSDDFEATVNPGNAADRKSNKLKVTLSHVPKSVKVMKIKPDLVEYIIISP